MPKMKTNKSALSRFKVTGTGKLMRQHPGRRHKLEKKSPERKSRLGKCVPVDQGQVKMYKLMMGV